MHVKIRFLDFSKYMYCYISFLQKPARTSNLAAPIMLLTGHEGEIFCSKFSPDGNIVASAGFDRLICKCVFNISLLTALVSWVFVRFILSYKT